MKENKTCRIYIRVTLEQKNKLQERATYFNLSITKFILKMCLEKDPILLNNEGQKELKDLRLESNQIIRSLNLYHEKRAEHSGYLSKVRNFFKRTK